MQDMSPGEQIDRFRLVREIGKGGMGVVYEAEEAPFGRRVALKILPAGLAMDEHAMERFRREIRSTGKLIHDHIVRIYSFGTSHDRPYYVMEYVEGMSLAMLLHLIRAGKEVRLGDTLLGVEGAGGEPEGGVVPEHTVPIAAEATASSPQVPAAPVDRALDLVLVPRAAAPPRKRSYYDFVAKTIADAAEALDLAHRQGIVHRDVKPSNLLLDRKGSVRVSDFGLAVEGEDVGLTQTGMMVGTPKYMSPEQLIAQDTRVDARTDIYSLGVTLYESVALIPPFNEARRDRLVQRITQDEPRAPLRCNPYVPGDLQTIALKAMEKDPARRYASAQLMADDLNRYLRRETILAVPPSTLTRCNRFVRRHKALCAIVGVAIGVAVVGAVVDGIVESRHRDAELARHLTDTTKALDAGAVDAARTAVTLATALDPDNHEVVRLTERLRNESLNEEERRRKAERELRAETLCRTVEPECENYRRAAMEYVSLTAQRDLLLHRLDPALPFILEEEEDRKALDQRVIDLDARIADCRAELERTYASAFPALMAAKAAAPDNARISATLAGFLGMALEHAEETGDHLAATVMTRMLAETDPGFEANGTVRLLTSPPGAVAEICRYVEQGGCLVAETVAQDVELDDTPRSLPAGSYLLILRREGYRPVRYPVVVRRNAETAEEVRLLREEEIGEDMVYVPAGESIIGGRPRESHWPLPLSLQRVPGFLISTYEVTCGEYAAFLTEVFTQRPETVADLLPVGEDRGKRFPEVNQFRLRRETGAELLADPNQPVANVSHDQAEAFCAWLSKISGRPVRLPTVSEWERAARGADGRPHVWGSKPIPGRANTAIYGRKWELMPVGSLPTDISPFGVFDMEGNVTELCAESLGYSRARAIKGNRWFAMGDAINLSDRYGMTTGHPGVGFRVACTLPDEE